MAQTNHSMTINATNPGARILITKIDASRGSIQIEWVELGTNTVQSNDDKEFNNEFNNEFGL